MMHRAKAALVLGTVLLAGCSQERRNDHREEFSRDESSSAPQNKFGFAEARDDSVTGIDIMPGRAAPPAVAAPNMNAPAGISVTAAPGVAFNYRYAFVLPDDAISTVQEQHASACEKLGPTRCRITGMRYTLVDEGEVRGQLRFKLDPALARNFGKEGIAAVTGAKGRLVDAAIEGNDVGTAISQSQRRSQMIAGEIERMRQRIAGGGLNKAEAAELERQIERLRQQQGREQETRTEGEEMLANTPMTFNYAGRKGFTLGEDPIGQAWSSSQSSFTTMVSIILIALGMIAPWALLAALLVVIWRKTPLRKLRLLPNPKTYVEPELVPAAPPSPPSPSAP